MKNILKVLGVCLVILFLTLLVAEEAGYYKSKNEKIKVLTEEQIKIFESDIKEGKEIDVTDYTKALDKNYSSKVSNSIYKISVKLENFVDKTFKTIFKIIEKSFE